MLSNLRTSTKVVAGFGIMLTILATLGVTGYVMFGSVQTNVTGLEDHSLAAAKNSTGVERAAFETIMEEKNYLLRNDDATYKKAMKKLGELAGSLDQVDKIAERFADANLAKKSKDVRELAAQYGKLYDQGVAALKGNKAGEATMDAKGLSVGDEATAFLTVKKAEYNEVMQQESIASQLEVFTWNARYYRQKVKYEKDEKYVGDPQ